MEEVANGWSGTRNERLMNGLTGNSRCLLLARQTRFDESAWVPELRQARKTKSMQALSSKMGLDSLVTLW
jgi:hypothetical protein